MDTCTRVLDSAPLSIQCRQCGGSEIDDYEVVEANSMQTMRCATCGTLMHFAVMECSACGAETLFPWSGEQFPEEHRSLVCGACERHYGDEATGEARDA